MTPLEEGAAEPADEGLVVVGEAPNVLVADAEAWERLRSVLSFDPIGAWQLVEMQHVWCAADPEQQLGVRVQYTATFVRDDTPTPRSKEEAEFWATEKTAEEA